MTALSPFGVPDIDRLTGLVFELASQLHVERARRLALETALIRAGALSAEQLETAGDSAECLGVTRQELDRSMTKLMRVLMEGGDAQKPLRAETPKVTEEDDR